MERQKMRQIGTMKKEFFPEIRKEMWVLRWKNYVWIGESWKEVMKKGVQKERELIEKTSNYRRKSN
ncbi:MAG: hypothetical protein PHP62_05125 [Candidatus Moranbacteria bacterium]|nr:hypothetical protein [Candidatus Moranbacteria bacterium]